jgi:hypothetical protein
MAESFLLVTKCGSYVKLLITCLKVIQNKKEGEKKLIADGAAFPWN